MRKFKTIAALFLVFTLVFTNFNFVFAVPGPDDLVIRVDNVDANPDTIIEVPIRITQSPSTGASIISALRIELGAGLTFHYPSAPLGANPATWPFISRTGSGYWDGMLPFMGAPVAGPNFGANVIIVSFVDTGAPFNSFDDGILLRLRVQVDAGATGTIPITVSGGNFGYILPNDTESSPIAPILHNGSVRIIAPTPPSIADPTGTFDHNPSERADVDIAVDLGFNESLQPHAIVSVTGHEIPSTGWGFDAVAGVLSFRSAFLETLPARVVSYDFMVTFNDNSPTAETVSITVIDTTPRAPSITNAGAGAFDLYHANRADVEFTIDWGVGADVATEITGITGNGIGSSNWSVAADTLTINQAFLATLTASTTPYQFEVTFNNATGTNTATISITVSNNPTQYDIGFATDTAPINGLTATGIIYSANPTPAGLEVTVRVTLTGSATARGRHTLGVSSAANVSTGITAVTDDVVDVEVGGGAGVYRDFTFTMPANAVADLVVTNTFVAAPEFVSITPANSATVSRNTDIVVTFSKAMNITYGEIVLTASGISGNITIPASDANWTVGDTVATFSPALANGETYTVTASFTCTAGLYTPPLSGRTFTVLAARTVNFSAGANGTLSAAIGGTGIADGASVEVGDSVTFTAAPTGNRRAVWSPTGGTLSDGEFDNVRTITVGASDITVNVTFAPIPVTGITVTGASGATTITTLNGTLQMSADVTPANAFNSEVTWSIEPPAPTVATISAGGLLQATGNGSVTVRATANDGSGVFGEETIIISGQPFSITVPTAYASYLNVTVASVPANSAVADASVTVNINRSGFRLVENGLTVNGTAVTSAVGAPSVTFTMPASDVTIGVTFEVIPANITGVPTSASLPVDIAVTTSVLDNTQAEVLALLRATYPNATFPTVPGTGGTGEIALDLAWSFEGSFNTAEGATNTFTWSAAADFGARPNLTTDNLDFLTGTVVVTNFTRHGGSAVNLSTPVGNATYRAVTVTAGTLATVTGQTIEYAITAGTSEPDSGWQTTLVFDNLIPSTTYRVYARTIMSNTHAQGTAVFAEITTAACPHTNRTTNDCRVCAYAQCAVTVSGAEHTWGAWGAGGAGCIRRCTTGSCQGEETHTTASNGANIANCTDASICNTCTRVVVPAGSHSLNPANCRACTQCSTVLLQNPAYTVPLVGSQCAACQAACGGHTINATANCLRCTLCGHMANESARTCTDQVPCVYHDCDHIAGPAATCLTPQTCTQCTFVFDDALGHTAGAAATCTTPQLCIRCPHEFAPELGHDTSGAVATCTTPQICARAGCTHVIVPALGHDWDDWVEIEAPTCLDEGEEERECLRCGAMDEQPIPALGHDWGAGWVVIRAATEHETGLQRRICVECDEEEEEVIPVTRCSACQSNPCQCHLANMPGGGDTGTGTVIGQPAQPPSGGGSGGTTGGETGGGETPEGPGGTPGLDIDTTISNPGAPGQVNRAVENQLGAYAAAGVSPDTITLTLPEGEDTLSVQRGTLETLVGAGAALSIEVDDAAVTIPTAALSQIARAGGGTVDISVDVTMSASGLPTVDISVTSGNREITTLGAPVRVEVAVNVEELEIADFNHYRLVATLADGTIVGGVFNQDTGIFEFETSVAGEFTITYVANLNRLQVQLGSPLIICLAENAEMQIMDVTPQIVDGRTVLPVRFMAEALGAGIDWNDDTKEVILTLDGRTLTFAIGEMAPGMDVPAQIIDGRTMVPLRFISEFFGAIVTWDEATRSIEIIYA
jgi:hypothetical protein